MPTLPPPGRRTRRPGLAPGLPRPPRQADHWRGLLHQHTRPRRGRCSRNSWWGGWRSPPGSRTAKHSTSSRERAWGASRSGEPRGLPATVVSPRGFDSQCRVEARGPSGSPDPASPRLLRTRRRNPSGKNANLPSTVVSPHGIRPSWEACQKRLDERLGRWVGKEGDARQPLLLTLGRVAGAVSEHCRRREDEDGTGPLRCADSIAASSSPVVQAARDRSGSRRADRLGAAPRSAAPQRRAEGRGGSRCLR